MANNHVAGCKCASCHVEREQHVLWERRMHPEASKVINQYESGMVTLGELIGALAEIKTMSEYRVFCEARGYDPSDWAIEQFEAFRLETHG